jgi:hypothetical protein
MDKTVEITPLWAGYNQHTSPFSYVNWVFLGAVCLPLVAVYCFRYDTTKIDDKLLIIKNGIRVDAPQNASFIFKSSLEKQN